MIKAIIFDAGGVLKDESETAIRRDAQTTLGIDPALFDEVWDEVTDRLARGVIDEATFWQELHKRGRAQHPLPAESLLLREYVKGYQPHEDVLALARRLQSAGYKIAVLSNTVAPHADFNRTHGLFDGFDAVILSHEVGFQKPSPEIFQATLQALGATAHETVIIDDREPNIRGAEMLGLHGLLFKNVAQLEQDLKNLGVSV